MITFPNLSNLEHPYEQRDEAGVFTVSSVFGASPSEENVICIGLRTSAITSAMRNSSGDSVT